MELDDDHLEGRTTQTGCLDVVDAIFTTRSMRRLLADPIPEWIVWDILDAAIRGPSSGNVQRWGWIVVTDPTVKCEIAGWYLDAWKSLEDGRRARLRKLVDGVIPELLSRFSNAETTDADPDPDRASGDHLANNLQHAPVWIIVVQRGVTGEPGLVDGADVYGAVQNLMLAARKHGIGSTLTMLHRRSEDAIGRMLGLPDDAATVALVPLGYPASAFSTPRRRPVEEVTHWGRWGSHRPRVRRGGPP